VKAKAEPTLIRENRVLSPRAVRSGNAKHAIFILFKAAMLKNFPIRGKLKICHALLRTMKERPGPLTATGLGVSLFFNCQSRDYDTLKMPCQPLYRAFCTAFVPIYILPSELKRYMVFWV
jgi:hypothetical protein